MNEITIDNFTTEIAKLDASGIASAVITAKLV